MAIFDVKQGDTFILDGVYEAGTLVDVSIASQMRRKDEVVTLIANVTDAPAGKFSVLLPSSVTDKLTVGEYRMDVQFTSVDGNVGSTDTFTIMVLEDVTNA